MVADEFPDAVVVRVTVSLAKRAGELLSAAIIAAQANCVLAEEK